MLSRAPGSALPDRTSSSGPPYSAASSDSFAVSGRILRTLQDARRHARLAGQQHGQRRGPARCPRALPRGSTDSATISGDRRTAPPPGTCGGARGLDGELAVAGSDRPLRHQHPFAARVGGDLADRRVAIEHADPVARQGAAGDNGLAVAIDRDDVEARRLGLARGCRGGSDGRRRAGIGGAGRRRYRGRRTAERPFRRVVQAEDRGRREQQRDTAPREPDDAPKRRSHV